MVNEAQPRTETFFSTDKARGDALSAARAGDREKAREVLADFCDRGTRHLVIEPDVLAYIGECLWTGMRKFAQVRQQAAKMKRGASFSFDVAFRLRPITVRRPSRWAPSPLAPEPRLPPNMGRWMFDLRAQIYNARAGGPAAGAPANHLVEYFCTCTHRGFNMDADLVAFIARGLRPLVSPLRGDPVKRLRLVARRAGRPAKIGTERTSRAKLRRPKRPAPTAPREATARSLDRGRPFAKIYRSPDATPRIPRRTPVYEQDNLWFDEEGRWIAFPEF